VNRSSSLSRQAPFDFTCRSERVKFALTLRPGGELWSEVVLTRGTPHQDRA
jgi:hypothetical protein